MYISAYAPTPIDCSESLLLLKKGKSVHGSIQGSTLSFIAKQTNISIPFFLICSYRVNGRGGGYKCHFVPVKYIVSFPVSNPVTYIRSYISHCFTSVQTRTTH